MGLKHVAFCAVLLLARAACPEPSHVAAAIHAGAAEARARREANLAAGAISGAGFVPIRGVLRHDDHVTSGSVLVGSGVPFIQLGVRGLLQPAPEEIWFAHVEDL